MPAGASSVSGRLCRWRSPSSARASRAAFSPGRRWRWMSAEAPRGWRVTPTPRSWRAFWLSAAVRQSYWTRLSVRRPRAGSGPRHTASSALRRGVSCRCLRQTLPSGRVLPKTQNLPPEKQRICSFLTGPQNGTTFTLSSAPSAAGVLPGSGRWNGKETSSVRWEPTRWQMVRHTWPAARPWKLCGAKASAGGSSSRWRMPSPPKAGCPSSCAAPSGCISHLQSGFSMGFS